jgi:hypothetical protein
MMARELHPQGIKPELEALRMLARLWAQRRTGVLRSPHMRGEARIIEGRAARPQDRTWIVQAAYVGGVEVHACNVLAVPGLDLLPELWACAMALANPSAVLGALDASLVERSAARRLDELPLAVATRRLLSGQRRPDQDLRHLCQVSGIAPEAVAQELSALVALGLFRLRRAAGRTRRARLHTVTPAQPGDNRQIQALRKRLEREWGLLADADDWTVVGVSQHMDAEVIRRACERMLGRYAQVASREDLPEDVRELARSIHNRVERAVGEIRAGRALTSTQRRLHEDPLSEGRRRLAAGDFANAARCFTMARNQGESALNVALLGWALYNDPGRPREARTERGMELLGLAESMGGHAHDVQLLRARAESAEGDLVRAWTRLDRILETDPDHTDARVLLTEVRQRLGR